MTAMLTVHTGGKLLFGLHVIGVGKTCGTGMFVAIHLMLRVNIRHCHNRLQGNQQDQYVG